MSAHLCSHQGTMPEPYFFFPFQNEMLEKIVLPAEILNMASIFSHFLTDWETKLFLILTEESLEIYHLSIAYYQRCPQHVVKKQKSKWLHNGWSINHTAILTIFLIISCWHLYVLNPSGPWLTVIMQPAHHGCMSWWLIWLTQFYNHFSNAH